MKRFVTLLLCTCVLSSSIAQTTVKQEKPHVVKMSNKLIKDLGKNEVAFTDGKHEYFIVKGGVKRREIGSTRKSKNFYIKDMIEIMGCCPEAQEIYNKGFKISLFAGPAMIFLTPPAAIVFAVVGNNKKMEGLRMFYDECLVYGENETTETAVEKNSVDKSEDTAKTTESATLANNREASSQKADEAKTQYADNEQKAEPKPVGNEQKAESKPVGNEQKAESKPVAQPQPKKVQPVKEKKVKEPKEKLPKLTERKPNGVGVFADLGGFAFRGPRLGAEIRLKKNIPLVYAGVPHLGSMFMDDYSNYESTKSISAGVGYKFLVPASWGGFNFGVLGQYNRMSGEMFKETILEQKVFDSGYDIMGTLGFRFQFKNNLYFNIGGYVGPSIMKHEYRYFNELNNSYSPTYNNSESSTNVKGGAEFSIGFEF